MAENTPTRTWHNPYWANTPQWARPIFENLSEFLARPAFLNGIELGDGTPPTRDTDTGVVARPPTRLIDTVTIDNPSPEVVAALDELDTEVANMGTTQATLQGNITTLQGNLSTTQQNLATTQQNLTTTAGNVSALQTNLAALDTEVTALETAPVAFTRITDVQIDTPHLVANSVTATKIKAGEILAQHIGAGQITAVKIDAGAVTADKIEANAVTAIKIDAGAVTADKIGASAVTAIKIDALAVTTAKLAADAVTATKLAAMYLSVGKYIRSATYDGTNNWNGTTGWAIGANGDAVFNNVIVRGEVRSSSIYSTAVHVTDLDGILRIYIGANTDRITFYNYEGQSSSLYQGTSTGLWSSGSFRSLVNLYADGNLAIGNQKAWASAPFFNDFYVGSISGARDGNINCGAVYNSQGNFLISDRIVKSHIKNALPGLLAKVKATPVRRYQHVENAELGITPGEEHLGWVAQECPDEATTDHGGLMAVNMNTMLATLWGAVQELAQKVEARP